MPLSFVSRNLPEMCSELENYLRSELCQTAAQKVGVGEKEADYISNRTADLVEKSEVFWASPDMSRLTAHAARSLPRFNIQASDVPIPSGVIFWGYNPSEISGLQEGIKVPMAALGWEITMVPGEKGGPDRLGLLLCMFVESEELIQHQLSVGATKKEEIAMRRMLPTVVNAVGHTAWVEFGEVDARVQDLVKERSVSSDVLISTAVLKTAWLLMGQELTEISTEKASRASVKRMQRMGRSKIHDVRVIDVKKRPSSGKSNGSSGREYQSQWLVNGHWRNQWYPSIQDHRPVWISPYLKGPEGAPLLVGKKVYSWHRQ